MELILQKRVTNLGNIGDIITVKAGYGRNYLIPYGFAIVATADNKATIESRRAELEAQEASRLAEAQKRGDALKEVSITITARASDEGKLYGSVGPAEIVTALAAAGHTIAKQEVIQSGPIRVVGEFNVILQLHTEHQVPLTVTVVAEQDS